MSGLTQAVRNFRNIWGQGDEEYSSDEIEDDDISSRDSGSSRDTLSRDTVSRTSSSTYPVSSYASSQTPAHGGGGSSSTAHKPRRMPSIHPGLRGREKNIYTIKPKSQDDATIAADCLKAGDAVIVNLEDVDNMNAVRIVDFMSGVCYGLDSRGHAMKLGDSIFLYTPGDFEIRSDEVDYGENEDLFFIDENPVTSGSHSINQPVMRAQTIPASQIPQHLQQQQLQQQAQQAAAAMTAQTAVHSPPTPSGYINPATVPMPAPKPPLPGAMPIPDRRTWER